jgi:membrane protease YdiL (CAAX protease family)
MTGPPPPPPRSSDRRLRPFDLAVILSTALLSLAFAFFGGAVSAAIYAFVALRVDGPMAPSLLAADGNLRQTCVIVGAIYGTTVVPLGIWGVAARCGIDLSSLGLRRPRWWWFGIALVALAILVGYDFVSVERLDPDGAIRVKLQKALLIRSDSLSWTLALWVIVAPVTAFTEELLYRGLLYRWFRERLPVWLAALVSAMIFALLHGTWTAPGGWMGASMALALTLFGVFAALLLEGSGSLWPPILMHFANNSLFVLGAYNPGGG